MSSDTTSTPLQQLATALAQAQSSLDSAQTYLRLLTGTDTDLITTPSAQATTDCATPIITDDSTVLEGVFDGKEMHGCDGRDYPVPANYASKSKLCVGDKMKLTIRPNGKMIYKQIEMIDRKLVQGQLVLEGSQYKVLTPEGLFNVLYASVTFYKAEVGDTVTIILPEGMEAHWGAVENVIR